VKKRIGGMALLAMCSSLKAIMAKAVANSGTASSDGRSENITDDS